MRVVFVRLICYVVCLTAWSSVNAFVSETEGLRFKSRAGQIGRGVVKSSAPQQHFF